MSTRFGRRPGRVARRAVIGAVAAWFAAVGGVAGVSWLAIQSAGYAVTGSRLIGTSLDAPPEAAGHPTAAPARASAAATPASRSAGASKSGHPSSSASATPAGPSAGGTGGQSGRGSGRWGNGQSTTGTSTGGQNQPGAGPGGGSTQAPGPGGNHNGGQSTGPSTPVTTPPASSSTSSTTSGATSQSTPGGLVVAECAGDTVYWSVEPANGWTTLKSEKIDHGVKTGFRRSERVVAVTITCDAGTPTIDVRSSSSPSD